MFYNNSYYTKDEVQSLDTMMAKDLGKTDSGKDIYNFSIDISDGFYIASFFYAGGCTLYERMVMILIHVTGQKRKVSKL